MSVVFEPLEQPRVSGDLLPAIMLATVVATSVVILCHLAVVLWLAWTSGSPGSADLTYTAQNFAEVFSDARTYTVLLDTSAFALVSLAVALAFGIPCAWIAERTDFRAKTLLFTLMAVGLLIPGFAAAMGWLFLLHPRIGLLNQFLVGTFGLAGPPLSITSILGMGWVQGLNLAPLAFIMTAAVFRSMDPTLEEAAEVHGAGPWRVLRRITMRLAWPGILAASIYIFMTAFAAFDVPAIIGWGNRIFTFTTYLYLLLYPQDVLPRYGLAAALSTVAMAIAAAMSWWYGAMQQRSRRFAVVTGRAYRPKLVKLGRRAIGAWLLIGTYLVLSKVMPIMLLIWSSLLPFFQLPSQRALATVSFRHYLSLPWELVFTAAWNTSILAVLVPTVTLAISLAFSWVVLRSKVRGRAGFDFIAFLPHAVPSIVFGVGALLLTLFVLQRALPIYGTIWILLVVFVIARISYGTRMTNSGLIQIHAELEESAQMSGATLWQGFRRISLPLLAPTLLYAWLWIALLVFRELTLAVILSSADNITFPVMVWSLWLGGGLGQAAALAMVMLAMMTPLIVLYWLFARRQGLVAS
ncbi:MAG: iron(III) transport system permease protein [Alphaproteobacteria bacterium]|nr:iron(III) transport system permease protein [Alphaproteobacteria bacterium]